MRILFSSRVRLCFAAVVKITDYYHCERVGGYVLELFGLLGVFTWCTIQRNVRLLHCNNIEKTSESIL